MTDALRAAAEQALKVLRAVPTEELTAGEWLAALTALSDALAAPVAPAVPEGWRLVPVDLLRDALESVEDYRTQLEFGESDREVMRRLQSALDAAPQPTPAAVPSAEPVAPAVPADAEVAALGYATNLAVAIHAKHYPEVTQWKPLETVLGLLTQIDNMTCGLVQPTPAPQPVALPPEHVERLQAAIEGECDGLAISTTCATAIWEYVVGIGAAREPKA